MFKSDIAKKMEAAVELKLLSDYSLEVAREIIQIISQKAEDQKDTMNSVQLYTFIFMQLVMLTDGALQEKSHLGESRAYFLLSLSNIINNRIEIMAKTVDPDMLKILKKTLEA